MRIEPYSPCPCGSGKKYKFCCYRKKPDTASFSATFHVAGEPVGTAPLPPSAADAGLRTAMDLNVKGNELLHRLELDEAIKIFQQAYAACADYTPALNNLALCYFQKYEIEKAIETQQKALAVPRSNPFGQASLALYCRYLPHPKEQKQLAEDALRRALEMHSVSFDSVLRTCKSLALYGWHQEILTLLETSDFGRNESLAFYGGVAAANLGEYERAAKFLKIAQRAGEPANALAKRYRRMLRDHAVPNTIRGNWPYFTPDELIPLPVYGMSQQALRDEVFTHSIAAVDLAESLVNAGEDMADHGLTLLGESQHPAARELLEIIARSVTGPDARRTRAAMLLKGDAPGSGKPQDLWFKGKQRSVITRRHTLNPDYRFCPDPPAKWAKLFKDSVELMQQNPANAPIAAEGFKKVFTNAPEVFPARFNYATTLLAMGRFAEAETILRDILREHPTYLFAASALLRIMTRQGRMDEARDWLRTYEPPEETHPDAWLSWLFAQLAYHVKQGDRDAVRPFRDMIMRLAPDHPLLDKPEHQL